MSEPRPLRIDPEATDFERSLLEAWRDEAPSPQARQRTLALVGLAAGAASVVTAGAAKGAGAGAATKAATAGGLALAKWAVATALLAGVAALAITSARAPAPQVVPAVSHAAPPFERPPAAQPTAEGLTPSQPAPPAVVTPTEPAPPRVRTREAKPSPAPSTLAEQVAALDRARAAVSAADYEGALRLVRDYEGRFPSGTLAQEAEVVRIEALVKRGDRDAAARAGAAFFAAHPSSPHGPRVRALLGSP